jgi:hypothetical protein
MDLHKETLRALNRPREGPDRAPKTSGGLCVRSLNSVAKSGARPSRNSSFLAKVTVYASRKSRLMQAWGRRAKGSGGSN